MDGICGMNPLGQNQGLSGFSTGVPTLDPSMGLASLNRLGGLNGMQGLNSLLPGAGSLTGSDPTTQALLQQSMQMNGMMLQMMQLLLGLMGSKLGANGAAGSTDAGGVSSVGSGGGGGGGSTSGTANPNAATGNAPPADTKDTGEVKSFIKQAASAYGADADVLTKIAEKESGFKAGAVNNWDSNAQKGTPSKGMFQFIESTFKSYATEAKKANPGAWAGLGELNWMDWRQQALACAWAITHGKGSAWATYKAAGGK